MKKTKMAAVALVFAITGPALAAHDVKSNHRLIHHHRVHGYVARPYDDVPLAAPRVLDHRDPTRPGGIDPSFNPPPT